MSIQPLEEKVFKTERRHWQRKKFEGNIEIDWGSTVLNANVRDIGPQGLFVDLIPPLWLGATFHARLMLNPVLLLNCTVARVDPRGIAVTFKVSADSDKAQLESLLLSLPAV
ncbi:MAG TPA: PilZ domain-containing protein [Candidatus Acidoferrales bacterium]|jgi:hypothetical protein|nr:PilZ domain-containing protein [Candidatus Acidoferrales bacterium]